MVSTSGISRVGAGCYIPAPVPSRATALLRESTLVVLGGVLVGLLVNGLRCTGNLDLAAAPHRETACAGVLWTTPEQASAALENGARPLLLDARETRHYEDAHIVGALSVPYREGDEIPAWVLERVGKARGKVIAYCDASGNCARSTKLAEALFESGAPHGEVEVLQGGFPAWEAAHLPAELGACRECP